MSVIFGTVDSIRTVLCEGNGFHVPLTVTEYNGRPVFFCQANSVLARTIEADIAGKNGQVTRVEQGQDWQLYSEWVRTGEGWVFAKDFAQGAQIDYYTAPVTMGAQERKMCSIASNLPHYRAILQKDAARESIGLG